MNDTTCFKTAISALRLAVLDATNHPNVEFARRNQELADRASGMAINSSGTSPEDRNRARVVLLLNRAVARYLARSVPTEAALANDLDALLRAIEQPGVTPADGAAAIDILCYFSDVARVYAVANPREWNTKETTPELEAVRLRCVDQAAKLARRSIAQKLAYEQLKTSEGA